MSSPGETARPNGYSLLEILIVLVVLGLVTTTLSWDTFRGGPETLDDVAEQIERLANTQRLLALQNGAPTRLYRADKTRHFVGTSGGTATIPDHVKAELFASVPPHENAPALVFLPDGQMLGGTIRLSRGESRRTLVLTGETGISHAQ